MKTKTKVEKCSKLTQPQHTQVGNKAEYTGVVHRGRIRRFEINGMANAIDFNLFAFISKMYIFRSTFQIQALTDEDASRTETRQRKKPTT